MTDDSLQLFEKAWELAESVRELPAQEREKRIAQACGNDHELRTKVDALLSAPVSSILLTSGFQKKANEVMAAATRDLIDDVEPGEQVGAYRLIKELGSGGMSRVYLGVREGVEFEQHVAVKLMRAFRTNDTEARARFEREQQVLASLSHANIANIIDGGVTPSNRPFLVMEFVDGETVTDYCQNRSLGLDERLELFLDVCAAVEHAHHRLVVHRDLKPSNILVSTSGQAKLLDFGIAKLLDDTKNSSLTRTGLMMLTPQYAAPEQVTGSSITTATDVYALGLVLYELITDAPAWEADSLSLPEQLRNICETQPALASSVSPSIAWSSRLRGDLDLIVAKALAKEPADRYPTCTELMRDIAAWQDGSPVSAHAPTLSYRLRKFSKRHWVGVVTGFAFIGVITAFITALLLQQSSIRLERDRAQEAQSATGAINRFLVDELLGATSTNAGYGRDVPVSVMLERAEETAGRAFAAQPALEASIRETLSQTFLRLGDLDRAQNNLSMAKRRLAQAEVADTGGRNQLALIELELQIAQGDAAGARKAATAELSRLTNSTRPHVADLDSIRLLVLLARAQKELDDWPQAQENLSVALTALEQNYPDQWRMRSEAQFELSKVLFNQRDSDAALKHIEERLELQIRYLGDNHPDILQTLRWQSTVLYRLQRKNDALETAERAYSLATRVYDDNHPEIGEAANALARQYVRARRYDESIELFRKGLETARIQFGDGHPSVLQSIQNLGVALSYAGNLEDAERAKRAAYEGYLALYGERSTQTIRALKNLSGTLISLGRTDEHRVVIENLVRVAKTFDGDQVSDPIQLNDAASLLLTCEPIDLRDPVAALAIARLAVARTERLKGEPLITLGDALWANGIDDEALTTFEEAAKNSDVLHIHALPRKLAALYKKTGQIERAESFFAEHLERRRAARSEDDWLLGVTWHELGRFYVNVGLGEKAIPMANKAIAQYRLTREESDPLIPRSMAVLGAAHSQAGDPERGEQLLTDAYNALIPEPQVTSEIKREIVTWLIDLYQIQNRHTETEQWKSELERRASEPFFSDWTR